jgi:hypothetical protein
MRLPRVDRGAEVTVVGRTFRDDTAARLTFVAADLSSMSEAVRLGLEFLAELFDAALFTAGIITVKTREETREHVERDVAISYLSRLAVLQGLSSRLGSAHADGAPKLRVSSWDPPATKCSEAPTTSTLRTTNRPLVAHANTVTGNEILVLAAKDRFQVQHSSACAPASSKPASEAAT